MAVVHEERNLNLFSQIKKAEAFSNLVDFLSFLPKRSDTKKICLLCAQVPSFSSTAEMQSLQRPFVLVDFLAIIVPPDDDKKE